LLADDPFVLCMFLLQMADSIKDSPPAEHIPRSPLKLFKILANSPLLPFFCVVGIMLSMASHTYIFWLPIIISALLRGTALTQTSVAAKAPAAGGTWWRSGEDAAYRDWDMLMPMFAGLGCS